MGSFVLFFNLSRNELSKKSSSPNINRGRRWHKMNWEGRRGKEGMRGKRGKGDGEAARTRPADAPQRRATRTRTAEGRVPRRRAPSLANSHISWQQDSLRKRKTRFSPPFTQEVQGSWFGTRARVPRALQVWDWLTELSNFSLDAVETRRFPSF